MARLRDQLRQRPLPRALTDGGLLVVLGLLGLVSALVVAGDIGLPVALAVAAAPLFALWWRHDAPMAVFLAVEVLASPSRVLTGASGPAELAVLAAVYTVASRRSLGRTAGAVVLDISLMGAWLSLTPQVDPVGIMLIGQLAALVVAALLGQYVQSRRTAEQALRDKADRLEHERELNARAAVEEERRRIARELHDVVAHHVSIMTLKAGGLEKQLQRAEVDPALEETASSIRQTGKQAMTELRRLLGLLHRDWDDDGRSPQPDLDALELMAARMRDTGMPLDLSVTGDGEDVSAGMALAVYRIVQEALTNTLRHAGAVPTSVLVEVRDTEVEVCIRDRGAPSAKPPDYPVEDGAVGATGGNGLVGMRERAALFAGTVAAGRHPDGGFEVRARLQRDSERNLPG